MKKTDPMTVFQIVVIVSVMAISLILFLMLKAIEEEALLLNN